MFNSSHRANLAKLSVAALLALNLHPSGVLSQQIPSDTFHSRSELVLVNVTVRDKNGDPVRDLKREDFTVMEDNKAQQVVSFDLENTDAVQPTAASELSLLQADQSPAATSTQTTEASPLKDRRLIVLFFDLS